MLFKNCEPFWNLLINVKIYNLLASKIQVEKLEAIREPVKNVLAEFVR